MENNQRAAGLDGLRGVAAVSVVFYHATILCDLPLIQRVLLPPLASVRAPDWLGRLVLSIFNGAMAVNIFFILSGLVLAASLKREPVFDVWMSARFVIRRVLRIYPALIVAIFVFGAASYVSLPQMSSAPYALVRLLRNALLLDYSVIGPTWTLQAEMLMVPVILVVTGLRRFFGPAALVIFLIFSMVCIFQGAPVFADVLNIALMAFALGMLIPTAAAREGVEKLPSWAWAAFLGLMVAVRFFAITNETSWLIQTLVLSAAAVAAIYHKPASGFLVLPIVGFFGRISYSLYLWHGAIMYELFPAWQAIFGADRLAAHYLPFGLAYGAIVVAITTPVAALTEKWVERPFISFGRRLSRTRVLSNASPGLDVVVPENLKGSGATVATRRV
jgi:peptidoglycan/LPS O-acetylase OafA/YrhL